MLCLKEFSTDVLEKEYQFIRDMPLDENGITNRWHGISWEHFKKHALHEILSFACGQNLPEGYVPQTFYFLWKQDEIVGQFRIRHYLNESLRTGAGHIGYFIKKEFRGNGYAKEGLRQALQIASVIIPENEIYLRVNKDNPSSLHVMLANGGQVEREDASRYYVRIPKPAKPEQLIGQKPAASQSR